MGRRVRRRGRRAGQRQLGGARCARSKTAHRLLAWRCQDALHDEVVRRGDQPSTQPSRELSEKYVRAYLSDDGGPERARELPPSASLKDRAIPAHARLRTHCASGVPCMYVRGNYVRTYVHACVRTCVVRTYAEVGHAVLPVLAAPCVPVVDASTCVPDVPVVPVPGVPDRTYVRMYVRTYVSERGHPAAKGGASGASKLPPLPFFFLRSRGSAGAPLSKGGASGATPPLPLC